VILAGDVGGTKTALALYQVTSEAARAPRALREAVFSSPDHPGLLPVLREFLAGEHIAAACFGVAGPVAGNRAATPNLAWVVDGAEIAAATGIPRVELVNDLVAMGEGIAALDASQLATLQDGEADPAGNAALLAAGTGLGCATLAACGEDGGLVPLPSEGGHADFAARTEDEIALLRFLRRRHGRVSVERVVSGLGLRNLYEFLAGIWPGEGDPEVARLLSAAGEADSGRVIGEAAAAGSCPLCARAVEMFVDAYGAVAGNLALTALATRGLYLGGGIAPKLLPQLADGSFLAAFRDKGRHRALLERIPVRVILEERTPLLGAARRATRAAARL
jgi:glucokinase